MRNKQTDLAVGNVKQNTHLLLDACRIGIGSSDSLVVADMYLSYQLGNELGNDICNSCIFNIYSFLAESAEIDIDGISVNIDCQNIGVVYLVCKS